MAGNQGAKAPVDGGAVAGAYRDVRLDFTSGCFYALGQTGHLEHGLLVAAGCHDVRVCLVLDALDCCPLWANN